MKYCDESRLIVTSNSSSKHISLEFGCIIKEINEIINNRKKYDNDIVLHALAILELINTMRYTKNINLKLIQFLEHIKIHINCHIDFEQLNYIYDNGKEFSFNENVPLNESTDSIIDHIDMNFEEIIEHESELLFSLMNNSEDSINHLDQTILDLCKTLFDLLDVDKDGYISAIDTLYILKILKKNTLLFGSDYSDIIVHLLTLNKLGKINFETFVTNCVEN